MEGLEVGAGGEDGLREVDGEVVGREGAKVGERGGRGGLGEGVGEGGLRVEVEVGEGRGGGEGEGAGEGEGVEVASQGKVFEVEVDRVCVEGLVERGREDEGLEY